MRSCRLDITREDGVTTDPCRPPSGLVSAGGKQIIVDAEIPGGRNPPRMHLFSPHPVFEADLAFQYEYSVSAFAEILGECGSGQPAAHNNGVMHYGSTSAFGVFEICEKLPVEVNSTSNLLFRCNRNLIYIVEVMSVRDYLGEFEHLVLLALMRLGDDAYGVTVRKEIEARTGREVSVGAVYATLDRLETKGYVTSFYGGATEERGGRSKRFFRMTAEGLAVVNQTQRALANMLEGLGFSWS